MKETDYSTKAGAERLAGDIRAYWAVKGYTVKTHISYIGGKSKDNRACWFVRTNMVNGLPVGAHGDAA